MSRASVAAAGVLTLTLGSIPTARAADPSVYVAGHVGWSNSSYDMGFVNGSIVGQATAAGASLDVTSTSIRRSDHAWWLDVGYLGSGYFGVAGSYIDFGEIHPHSLATASGSAVTGPTQIYAGIRSRGPALAFLGVLPLGEHFEVDARLGLYYGKTTLATEFDSNAGSAPTSQSATSSSALGGVGAGFSFDGHWSARVDVLYVRKTGDNTVGVYDVGAATLGIAYAF